MQITAPQVGKTYVSRIDPTLTLYVEDVLVVQQDEFGEGGFVATGCSPADKGNPEALCYELLSDEWAEFHFVQVAA